MEELIERFCTVTGTTSTVATQFLDMTNGDIDHAIEFYFDSDQSDQQNIDNGTQSIIMDESSRTPIPQKHERLIDPELPASYNTRRRQQPPSLDNRGVFAIDPQQRPSTSIDNLNQNGSGLTLERMFEPPVEILFNGNFEEAKAFAKHRNVWLIVSVHNNEVFDCHRLNRDLWKNSNVESLIKKSFVFWQVLFNKVEAQNFIQWYDYNKDLSHLAIIDPVTGECKLRLMGEELSNTNETYKILHDFVLNNGGAVNGVPSNSKKRQYDQDFIDLSDSIPKIKKMKIISPSSSASFSEMNEETDVIINERWYDYMGRESDPIFTILLRMPSGDRDMISLPSSSKLKALFLYIYEKGCDVDKYELVKCFPKKLLTTDMENLTLENCGILNKDTIHVQERM